MNDAKCSQCDKKFECGVDELSCWCMDMERVQPIEGQTCLCPECLRNKIRYNDEYPFVIEEDDGYPD